MLFKPINNILSVNLGFYIKNSENVLDKCEFQVNYRIQDNNSWTVLRKIMYTIISYFIST